MRGPRSAAVRASSRVMRWASRRPRQCGRRRAGSRRHPDRYRDAGGGFVSINVGYAPHSYDDTTALLRSFRSQVDADASLVFAATTEDIDDAVASGRTAVAFDVEDSAPLDGDLSNVARLVSLGVRTMLPTYNHRNGTERDADAWTLTTPA